MGSVGGLDILETRKSHVPTWIRTQNRQARNLVFIPTTLSEHLSMLLLLLLLLLVVVVVN